MCTRTSLIYCVYFKITVAVTRKLSADIFHVFQLAKDLLHPTIDDERRQHKKKRLVQTPNSYFMDVKCPGIVHLSPLEPICA